MGLASFNKARRQAAEKEELEKQLAESAEEVEPEVEPEEDDDLEDVDLEDATLGQLRAMAKKAGVKGFRKMDREALIEELEDDEEEE